METATRTTSAPAAAATTARDAYRILQFAFVVAPIVAGLDKFFNILVTWEQYLAPFVGDLFGARTFMIIVGVIEIVAGIGVALRPKIFAYIVAAWLVGIILNLLITGYYDIALRDLGLALGALALGRLATAYEGR